MLLEDVEALKNHYPDRVAVHHILSREKHDIDIHEGRLDAEKVADLWDAFLRVAPGDEYLLCGPDSMIEDVTEALKGQGVAEDQIHFERFGVRRKPAGAALEINVASETAHQDSVQVSVVVDGVRNEFGMSEADDTVLSAATAKGVDLPYSCTAGVCSTCRAKLIEGEVEMVNNYALEPWEVEAGFILTCQAKPKSKKLTLTYDEQ